MQMQSSERGRFPRISQALRIGSLALLAAFVLAGCGPKQPAEQPGGATETSPPAPGNPGALTPGQPPGTPAGP
jgi:hypothetical protein